MAAVVHGVGEVVEDGLTGDGEVGGAGSLLAEEFVHGAGGDEEFAVRVGPLAGVAGLEQQRAGEESRGGASSRPRATC